MDRYLALDAHKSYIHGGEWDAEAKKVRHFRVPNTPEGWEALKERVDGTCRIAIEATGNAFELHDLLRPCAAEVAVKGPLELKRLGSGRHTDRVDVDRLVQMLLLGTVPPVWVPPEPCRSVRRLLGFRERLVCRVGVWRLGLGFGLCCSGLSVPGVPHSSAMPVSALPPKIPYVGFSHNTASSGPSPPEPSRADPALATGLSRSFESRCPRFPFP